MIGAVGGQRQAQVLGDPVRGGRGLRTRRLVTAAGLWVGLVLASFAVWRTSSAAFSASTSNAGNSWAAGTVTIGDNDSGVALFNATALTPGATDSRCIVVSYSGTVAAGVRLYAGAVAGGLAAYLDLTVEEGTGGGSGSCSTFSPTGTLFAGTLSGFGAQSDFATGVGTWSPLGAGETRTYRFSYAIQNDNAAQGQTGAANFVWEARSS